MKLVLSALIFLSGLCAHANHLAPNEIQERLAVLSLQATSIQQQADQMRKEINRLIVELSQQPRITIACSFKLKTGLSGSFNGAGATEDEALQKAIDKCQVAAELKRQQSDSKRQDFGYLCTDQTYWAYISNTSDQKKECHPITP